MTPVVVVTGLSGAGKASTLRALEDLGFEAVDNPPVSVVEMLAARAEHPLAIGLDARTRGFAVADVLATVGRLRANPELRVQLVYAWAETPVLLRRFTETRRRHPLAPQGLVADGIEAEAILTAPLRLAADLMLDTSELPLADLRRIVGHRFGSDMRAGVAAITLALVSFAFPAGLPREADMVLDARFLRNPHYDPTLRPGTGLDHDVGRYIEADRDFSNFYGSVLGLLQLVLPRFIREGKKYATVAVGCTGGRHRSVYIVERLAADLRNPSWHIAVVHRELKNAGETAPPPSSALESAALERFETPS